VASSRAGQSEYTTRSGTLHAARRQTVQKLP